jgi:predicted nucleic acid-binding protein
MNDRIFVDTNVLVYAALEDQAHADKRNKAAALLRDETDIVLSTQVINEFYVVLLKHGFSDKDIQQRVDELFQATELL